MEEEYFNSIKQYHSLSKIVLNGRIENAIPYLCTAYETIVSPFENEILKMMNEIKLTSEGLF